MPEAPAAVMPSHLLTVGVLSGGKGQRVGGKDKGLIEINRKPLIEWVLQSISTQLSNATVLISANRNLTQYSQYAPTLSDRPDHQGPLAGVAALLERCQTEWLLTLPCDCPKLPPNFGEKLAHFLLNAEDAKAAVVNDGQRNQNAVLLIRKSELAGLREHLNGGGGAIHKWLATLAASTIIFDDWPAQNWNANTVDALQTLIDEY